MASFQEHCEDCIKELGKPYEEVHIWLDELWTKLGPKHRSVRHHTGGIAEVKSRWGIEASKAAEIHIRKDYYGHIPSPQEAQAWSIFGAPRFNNSGGTYLTDSENPVDY